MQKDKLSAFMDGEALDNEVIAALTGDAKLQRSWQNYHLIRDTLRGDITGVIHMDIAARVAAVIEQEATKNVTSLIFESQPHPIRWQLMPFWNKIRPWAAQVTQVGVAACVSLAVIVGVQHHNQPVPNNLDSSDSPVFNTLPMMGQASPVSYGVPQNSGANGQIQDQHRRANALLQDYELQRRLYAEQLQIEQNPAKPDAAAQVTATPSLGNQPQ